MSKNPTLPKTMPTIAPGDKAEGGDGGGGVTSAHDLKIGIMVT
jgi:hypothetical protein